MTLNLRFTVFLILISLNIVAMAEGQLLHDPFSRPLISNLPTNNAETTSDATNETLWSPQLTAVMVAGKHSLATVDGVTLKLGEEKDGYKLIQVKDHEAIFKKGKKRVVLNIPMMTARQNKERGVE